MTLAIDPVRLAALFALAKEYEVELSDIGEFNCSGLFEVFYGSDRVAALELHFLHHGLPQKRLRAAWTRSQTARVKIPQDIDFNDVLLRLLHHPNICSRENIVRQFDHEVKGRTVLKAFMGQGGQAPQDAALLRLDLDGYRGIAVSNGIMPRYGLLDPYAMSAGSFDKAVRQIIAIGGSLPDPQNPDAPWWSACDNFCMPDVAYDAQNNPDGPRKLGALVQMAQGLYDSATAYGVPLTSGKDSMKNDLRHGDDKISVMPTVLYSLAAGFADIRRAVTTEFKAAGDAIFLLGETYDELGGSVFLQLFDQLGRQAPQVRFAQARDLYQRLAQATAQGLVESCHDLGLGGLAVALAECCIGSGLGADIELDTQDLDATALLFSESHSRFVATVKEENIIKFNNLLGNHAAKIGCVSARGGLRLRLNDRPLISLSQQDMLRAWSAPPD